jgi:hypothetical protein
MRTLPGALAAALLLAAPAYGANANFLAAQNYRAHTGPASLVTGSYIADGFQWGDVVAVNQASNDISFLGGSPFGSLGAPANRPAAGGPVSVTFGPADADDDVNLAIANRASNPSGTSPISRTGSSARRGSGPRAPPPPP